MKRQPFFLGIPVDGVILLNPKDEDPRIVQYKRLNLPYVLIGRPDKEDVIQNLLITTILRL